MKVRKPDEKYRDWIERSSNDRRTRVLLAIDLDGESPRGLFEFGEILFDLTREFICGVRFGRQTVLNLGPDLTRKLTGRVHGDRIPCIIDDKLSDIGSTNEAITRAYYRMGFDAIIVNPLSGWKGGLEPVFQVSHEGAKGVIVLAYMSHPGASETFGRQVLDSTSGKRGYLYEKFARKAVEWRSDGAVVGATRPNIIRKVKMILDEKVPIYSPGVGAQGGDLEEARRAGADYFIIGRSIRNSNEPAKMAAKFARTSFTI